LHGFGNHVMSIATAFAIYFIIWWVVLFLVLPWGVRSQEESGTVSQGTDPGAPVVPRLWLKLVWTTVVSLVVFGVVSLVYLNRWLTFDDLAALLHLPR
jgi:predicted secreted protein